MGRLNFKALREEEHRFDDNNHTRASAIRQSLCCTAAMHQSQQSLGQMRSSHYALNRSKAVRYLVGGSASGYR